MCFTHPQKNIHNELKPNIQSVLSNKIAIGLTATDVPQGSYVHYIVFFGSSSKDRFVFSFEKSKNWNENFLKTMGLHTYSF